MNERRIYRPETRQAILNAIMEAPEPVPAAKLAKAAGVTERVAGAHLPELLADATSVFNWGNKSKPVFWHRDTAIVARERLIDLAARENFRKGELAAGAAQIEPKIGLTKVRTALNALLREEILREGVIKPAGQRVTPPRVEEAKETVQDVAQRIFAAMNRIAFAPGTTVTFQELRRQPELAGVPKRVFDEAAFLLEQNRKALLTVHGHAASLAPEERDLLVTDRLGTYYASIYAR